VESSVEGGVKSSGEGEEESIGEGVEVMSSGEGVVETAGAFSR